MWLSLFDQSTVDMTSAIAMTHALFWTGTVMFVFMGCTDADDHYIQPKVYLTSCLARNLYLTITDLQEGGVMYITKNGLAYNMQLTQDGNMTYSCSFDECGLGWNSEFLFVVQRKPLVQTTHDVHLVFACIADQGDILPDDGANKDQLDNGVTTFLFRAQAEMRFFNETTELPNGSYIKLGSSVLVLIQITNNVEDMMDINVKSCEASGISMLDNRCPVDEDLFGVFNKTSVGVLTNSFLMFRTTTLIEEPVTMMFSCVLEVCYAPCSQYDCNGTEPVTVSRRRRDASGDVTRIMSVTKMFQVGTKDPVYLNPDIKSCIHWQIFIIVFSLLVFALLPASATASYYTKQWSVAKSKILLKVKQLLSDPEASLQHKISTQNESRSTDNPNRKELHPVDKSEPKDLSAAAVKGTKEVRSKSCHAKVTIETEGKTSEENKTEDSSAQQKGKSIPSVFKDTSPSKDCSALEQLAKGCNTCSAKPGMAYWHNKTGQGSILNCKEENSKDMLHFGNDQIANIDYDLKRRYMMIKAMTMLGLDIPHSTNDVLKNKETEQVKESSNQISFSKTLSLETKYCQNKTTQSKSNTGQHVPLANESNLLQKDKIPTISSYSLEHKGVAKTADSNSSHRSIVFMKTANITTDAIRSAPKHTVVNGKLTATSSNSLNSEISRNVIKLEDTVITAQASKDYPQQTNAGNLKQQWTKSSTIAKDSFTSAETSSDQGVHSSRNLQESINGLIADIDSQMGLFEQINQPSSDERTQSPGGTRNNSMGSANSTVNQALDVQIPVYLQELKNKFSGVAKLPKTLKNDSGQAQQNNVKGPQLKKLVSILKKTSSIENNSKKDKEAGDAEMHVKFESCLRAGRRHSSLKKTDSLKSLISEGD